MTEEEILSELQTIRTLLTLDKEERLQQLLDELDEKHIRVLEELTYTDWRNSSEFISDVADELDVSNKTIQRKLSDLVEKNMVNRKGKRSGTKYKKSGLLRAASFVGDVQS